MGTGKRLASEAPCIASGCLTVFHQSSIFEQYALRAGDTVGRIAIDVVPYNRRLSTFQASMHSKRSGKRFSMPRSSSPCLRRVRWLLDLIVPPFDRAVIVLMITKSGPGEGGCN
jgi:hypothetical protein